MGGAIFVFRNRRGTSLKLLCYDLGEAPRYVELWEAIAPYSRISKAPSPPELHITQLSSEGLQPRQDGGVVSPRGERRLCVFFEGAGPFEGLTLGLEVDGRVTIGRFDA